MGPRGKSGNVAIIVAISLIVLLGFVALVVDIGHFWTVKSELQNAVDAAALAGARDLDGTAPKLPIARASAQYFGEQHVANQSDVQLGLNLDNEDQGNIVLGNWDFPTRSFTAAGPMTPTHQVNAVRVTARRTTEEGGAVATTFGALLGKTEQGIVSSAVAVGGSPGGVCGFPLAVADCSLFRADGSLRCNQTLTFGQATTDNVGFTLYSVSNPTTPSVTCMMARDLGSPCPNNCDCTSGCNATSTEDGAIKISNGNNLSDTSVTNINNAVLAAGAAGLHVQIAVVASGTLTFGTCGTFNYNQSHQVVGYVDVKLTGATSAPYKSVTATIDCTQSGPRPPGGNFYGYKSSTIYLVK